MPNGYQERRDRVWGKSRVWGFVWQVGDTAYYLGGLGSIMAVLLGLFRFKTWDGLLRAFGLGAVLFVACFPVGFLVCALFKGQAEHCTGEPH